MREIAPGIWHWTARHPVIGMDVSSYYMAGSRVLIDPLVPDELLERLEQLGPPREALLTNRHHWRDCSALSERFGVSVRASEPGMHEFSDDQPVRPFAFGEELAGGAAVAHEVGGICPDESALHFPEAGALAVADGVINYDGLRFVPDNLMDEPEQTKQRLRSAYRRIAAELEFDHLLTAHGEPVIGDARERLRAFAEG